MKLYIDSGNLSEIEHAVSTGLIDGITTNPSLVAKEGMDFVTLLKKIITIIKKYKVKKDFTLSAEVTSENHKDMVKDGIKLAALDPHIIVKIPLTEEGLLAVQELKKKKIRCNVTLCFSENQALLAAKAGAYIISPFVGRLDDAGQDGINLVEEIATLYDIYGFDTQIISASIRGVVDVKHVALAGSDIATIPYKIFMKMFNHPLTDKGLASFTKDWNNYKKELAKHKVKKTKSGKK